jgi:hypothetical protein
MENYVHESAYVDFEGVIVGEMHRNSNNWNS